MWLVHTLHDLALRSQCDVQLALAGIHLCSGSQDIAIALVCCVRSATEKLNTGTVSITCTANHTNECPAVGGRDES